MKKSVIFIIVAVFVLILALRYLENKSGTEKAGVSGEEDNIPQGVILPKEAKNIAPEEKMDNLYSGETAQYGTALEKFDGEDSYKGACKGGSLKDILESHGKLWGYSVRNLRAFKYEETEEIYDALAKYTACRALALDDIVYCGRLPGPGTINEDIKIDYHLSPQYKCLENFSRLKFFGYMAGKNKNKESCRVYLANELIEEITGGEFSDAFCREAYRGMKNICDWGKKSGELDQRGFRICKSIFPGKLSECSQEVCREHYAFYKAVKTGNYKKCPAKSRDSCKAYINKKISPCLGLALNVSKVFCKHLKRVKKVTNNAPGLSDQEIQELNAKMRKKREEEKKRKAKDEEIMKKVNSRVKKILGKE